jgi:molecular chaperone GrpE (heat shock protein)
MTPDEYREAHGMDDDTEEDAVSDDTCTDDGLAFAITRGNEHRARIATLKAELAEAREYGDEWLKQIYRLEADLAESRTEVERHREKSAIRRTVAIESIALLGLTDVRGERFSRETVAWTFDHKVDDALAALTPKEADDE